MMKTTYSRYRKSNILLEKALKIIPSGAQSSSKSIKQFPYGISPYFIEKALGCRTWDVDGNEYIDFISDSINSVKELKRFLLAINFRILRFLFIKKS